MNSTPLKCIHVCITIFDDFWKIFRDWKENFLSSLTLPGSAFWVFSLGLGLVQRPKCQKLGLPSTDWDEIWQWSYKNMVDEKFESGSFSSFGNMTSQNFLLKNGMSQWIRIWELMGLTLRKNEFLYLESFFLTHNWPPSPLWQFQHFSSWRTFSIFKIFEMSWWEKGSSNPSDWQISLEFSQRIYLGGQKQKSWNFWWLITFFLSLDGMKLCTVRTWEHMTKTEVKIFVIVIISMVTVW